MNQSQAMEQMKAAITHGDTFRSLELISSYPQHINDTDLYGTWLHLASDCGSLEIVQQLVEHGADINKIDGLTWCTPISRAISNGHTKVVQYLLSKGARLDADTIERNPLLGAIEAEHLEIVKLLVDSGIDLNHLYDVGRENPRTALQYATDLGCAEIAAFLRSKEATSREDSSPEPAANTSEAVIRYFSEHFGRVDPLSLMHLLQLSNVSIRIHVVRPTTDRQSIILFTTGMSESAMTVPLGTEEFRFAELMIELPIDWNITKSVTKVKQYYWVFEILFRIAQYPHDAETYLGGKYTIFTNYDPPEPLGPNVGFSSVLLVADYLDVGPVIHEDKIIHVYTLFPLYEEEKNFEIRNGAPALLERLSKIGSGRMLSVDRRNAITC